MEHKRVKSRVKILYECNEIRRLMFRGNSNREIMDTLKVKRRTFYRYLERIYDEDRVEIEEQNRKNLATRIKLFRERLFDTINNCQVIATDTNVAPKDRINAESVKVQVSLVAFKLEQKYTFSFKDSTGEVFTFSQKTLSEIMSGLHDLGHVQSFTSP